MLNHIFARCLRLFRPSRPNGAASLFRVLSGLLAAQALLAGANPALAAGGNQRKALVMGRKAEGDASHPRIAMMNFLRLVGNPENDPAKGWTGDFEWDLKVRLGMNPTNTSAETLFKYIGKHRLGYRIAMNCGPTGQLASYWDCAVDNGIMPFAPHYNNNPGLRFDDPAGIRAAVSVAGGRTTNGTSFGPSLEFIDAVSEGGPHPAPEDIGQSWANQALAAKFARVLDAHPRYNIWDAREHLRQTASFWATGWTETNGYGRVNEQTVVDKLLPGSPVEFQTAKSRDRHQVVFTWRNFQQTDFAATVIARKDGRILYQGTNTRFAWSSDVEGDETFLYWSRNKTGEKSRIEFYQTRVITGLNCGRYQTCLVLGAPATDEGLTRTLCDGFEQVATNWVCDMAVRPGNAYLDKLASFPAGPVAAVLPDFSAMVSYAISNHYRIVLAPVVFAEQDLYHFKSDWDRATAAGILVVLPHHASLSSSRKPQARRLSPPCLSSAVTVGAGLTTNRLSFGPGLEFFDAPATRTTTELTSQMDAAAVVAGKLAQVLDAFPQYNPWDARQHLRQSSSYYATGWVEDGGYGRPPAQPVKLAILDPAPPLEIQAIRSAEGDSVTFSWQNFLQTSFAETVIMRKDGRAIYRGNGTSFRWPSDVAGDETFRFFSQDKSGRLSKSESYTILNVTDLHRKL